MGEVNRVGFKDHSGHQFTGSGVLRPPSWFLSVFGDVFRDLRNHTWLQSRPSGKPSFQLSSAWALGPLSRGDTLGWTPSCPHSGPRGWALNPPWTRRLSGRGCSSPRLSHLGRFTVQGPLGLGSRVSFWAGGVVTVPLRSVRGNGGSGPQQQVCLSRK